MKIGNYEIQVPFVTTSSDKVKTLIELADYQPGEKAVDLGCGDGRVVLELAKAGFTVHGYEIKPELVTRARQRIKAAGLDDRAFVHQQSFWDADLSGYDLIYIYGMKSIMGRLEKKLDEELTPGTKFISNIFRLPHWKVKKESDKLYLCIKA